MADEPTTADPAPEPEPADSPAAQPETDWKAEAEKWKAQSRKHEDRAKANSAAAKKLADIEAASQTETERAQAAAKAAEERAAAAEQRAASALIRSTLVDAGYSSEHAAALIEDMNVARYIGDDGQVDTDAVRGKYAPLAPASGPRAPGPNPAQGSGGRPKTLGELVADAEKASSGSRNDTLAAMRLKSRMALRPQQQ